MKSLTQSIQEALKQNSSIDQHKAGKQFLLKHGFEEGKTDTVTRNGETYVVRSHKMPMTHAGLAIIADFYEINNEGVQNMIFVDPYSDSNKICILNRTKLAEFIRKNSTNRSIMWLTTRKDDPNNPGSASCMTILLSQLEKQQWATVETLK